MNPPILNSSNLNTSTLHSSTMNLPAANPPAAAIRPRLPDCEPRRLASDLFHALSQPLTTLCCSLELALQQTPTREQYRECVAGALAHAEQVSWLATGVRELLDAGEAGEDSALLQLQAAVDDAVTDLLTVAESAGVRIRYLPGSNCRVRFEAQRLQRGLFHLLGFVLGWGTSAAVVKVELVDVAEDVVLALTVSGAGAAVEARAEPAAEDGQSRELVERLGLGIARATFEAAGGSLCARLVNECLSVEVRLPRAAGR